MITDIHMHCIYGVDDGAESENVSIEMINMAYNQGVTNIICTPHDSAFNNVNKVRNNFHNLTDKCKKLFPNLKLYLGCEIYVVPEFINEIIKEISCGKLPTMNGTKYVLIEFPTYRFDIDQAAYCLNKILENDFIPIIAHIERYGWMQNKLTFINELKEMGCLMQINAYDISDNDDIKIKDFTNILLDSGVVDFLGSDAHRMNHRPPKLENGIATIKKKYNQQYINKVCFENAKLLLNIGDK